MYMNKMVKEMVLNQMYLSCEGVLIIVTTDMSADSNWSGLESLAKSLSCVKPVRSSVRLCFWNLLVLVS